jgi:hypothetical protein
MAATEQQEAVFADMVCQICGLTTGGRPPAICRDNENRPEYPTCNYCKHKGCLILREVDDGD